MTQDTGERAREILDSKDSFQKRLTELGAFAIAKNETIRESAMAWLETLGATEERRNALYAFGRILDDNELTRQAIELEKQLKVPLVSEARWVKLLDAIGDLDQESQFDIEKSGLALFRAAEDPEACEVKLSFDMTLIRKRPDSELNERKKRGKENRIRERGRGRQVSDDIWGHPWAGTDPYFYIYIRHNNPHRLLMFKRPDQHSDTAWFDDCPFDRKVSPFSYPMGEDAAGPGDQLFFFLTDEGAQQLLECIDASKPYIISDL